mmetsp:Transcript_19283/g.47682  ORF Transcript_19283/g.47682 Transcript_19283/m.47682 type:complete len:393 (+) Transcript_19283:134-1312(+)
MARRQRRTEEGDPENPGLQRPPPSEEEPHRYLCLVISFPGVILLGIAAALIIFLISLKSNNSEAIATSAPSPEDPFWFDISENLGGGGNNDDVALSFPTRQPTQNPTRITSSTFVEDDDRLSSSVTEPPILPLPQVNPPTLLPTPLLSEEAFFLEDAKNRFQEILESKSRGDFTVRDKDADSPQTKALNWLVRDPNLYSYSGDRVLQRWVLATFAFGMVSPSSENNVERGGAAGTIRSQEPPLSIPQAMQNWVRYTDECTRWYYTLGDDNGKTLCNSEGLYVRLDLRLQNLVGTLPSEIALLSNHLRYIHLFDNRLYGTVPSEFGLLTQLERLELTKNNLEGEVPTELGNLDRLRFLGLGQNSFSGPLPSEMGKLSRLSKCLNVKQSRRLND